MAKNIQLIIGSTRQNRVAKSIAEWIVDHVNHEDINLEIIDLKEVRLPAFDAPVPPAYAPVNTDAGKKWAETIAKADGYIFLTAEYNRSIPSSLKNALDYLVVEWRGKPSAIVSYGYVDGGQSAARHLKDILGWLKVPVVEPAVALRLEQGLFSKDGSFNNMDESFAKYEEMLNEAASRLAEHEDRVTQAAK
jgi:NAD(P)H-dependent FMN reductase